MAHAKEIVTLMNACMVTDDAGQVLVLERVRTDWTGIAFPGGHVEFGESLTDSVIREVREETGLTIEQPRLVGVKDWLTSEGRSIVLMYRAERYSGILSSSDEGRVFWTPIDSLTTLPLAPGIENDIRLLTDETISEHYICPENEDQWQRVLK